MYIYIAISRTKLSGYSRTFFVNNCMLLNLSYTQAQHVGSKRPRDSENKYKLYL